MRTRSPILPGNRYRVTVISRPERDPPFQLRIRDRLTNRITREVVRDLTPRQRIRAYDRAAERERELNSGRSTERYWSWAEAKQAARDLILAETARATAAEYLWAAGRLETYWKETFRTDLPSPDAVGEAEARRFIGWRRKGRSVEAATVNKDLRSLHALWTYLIAVGAVHDNPWDAVPKLEELRRVRTRLTLAQTSALLAESATRSIRFQACLGLDLDTAMRARELSHLTWQHVDLAARSLLITREPCGWEPKDHEEGVLWFSEETAKLLKKLYDAGRNEHVERGLSAEEAAVLLSGSRVFGSGHSSLEDKWERAYNAELRACCRAAGVPEITSHGLRRSAARHAREAGAEARDIQAMLRHSSFSTTRLYIGDDQADAAHRAHRALQSVPKLCHRPESIPAQSAKEIA